MLIFVPLAFAGFLVVAGAFIFGHDQDVDHDVDQDGGYEVGSTLSFFSVRVLATFVMGFGAAGGPCKHVVGKRLNQSGMVWSHLGSSSVLSLLVIWLNDRWEQLWQTKPLAA